VRERGALFIRAFDRHLRTEFERVLVATLAVAKARAPFGDHNWTIDWSGGGANIQSVPGGVLRRSLTFALTDMLDVGMVGQIGVPSASPAAKYARMAELGGTIHAKSGPYLIFSPDGQTVVRTAVVHREAHPYIIPALAYAWPLVKRIPELAFARAADELGMAAA
jgi:hypothetical protein